MDITSEHVIDNRQKTFTLKFDFLVYHKYGNISEMFYELYKKSL